MTGTNEHKSIRYSIFARTMRVVVLFLFFVLTSSAFAQETKVYGLVTDEKTGEPIPFVKIRFKDTNIGTETDFDGKFSIKTRKATDSLVFSSTEYLRYTIAINKNIEQEITVMLKSSTGLNFDEVTVRPDKELKSTRIHKKIIANKPNNNKDKLESYSYEFYNKMQIDISNISKKHQESGFLKRIEEMNDYIDSTEEGKKYVPMMLSESLSDIYFKKSPPKRREITKATRLTGVDRIDVSQFLGNTYFDINIYNNSIVLFNKNFVSPIANDARNIYKFVLLDSLFEDNRWCYLLKFYPRTSGLPTFEGTMLVHDTTFAVKRIEAKVSPWVDINFIKGLEINQEFDFVQDKAWMMTKEDLFAEVKILKKAKGLGVFMRKKSVSRNFEINQPKEDDFYHSNSNVEFLDSAKMRDAEYWEKARPVELSIQEKKIDTMISQVKKNKFFKLINAIAQIGTTGFFTMKKIEIGNAFTLFGFNKVEKFRLGLNLRTSTYFSKRIQLGGHLAYGFRDKQFKYGALMRILLTRKKRGLMTIFYKKDIEQIGTLPDADIANSTLSTLFSSGSLNKLTLVEKTGINIEKDLFKNFIVFGGLEWKEYTPLGISSYVRMNKVTGLNDTIRKIRTGELLLSVSWTKKQEFISGVFNRKRLFSRFPTLTLRGLFGIKGLFGTEYRYQKVDFSINHRAKIGRLGRLFYNISVGKFFGKVAHPFLQIHEGNQSVWLQQAAFNKMNYLEFISDQYVTAKFEHHWDGLLFNAIPGVRKLQMRLVTSAKFAWGTFSKKNNEIMTLPSFTKRFGKVPYVEVGLGIENILKLLRVDVIWRLTHTHPKYQIGNIRNFAIRFRYAINF